MVQLTADASSTISSLSSRRVIVKTRCTGSGPRTMTTPAAGVACALVGGHETAQPGGVEEREAREIEHDDRGLVGLHSPQLVLNLGHRGEVQLSLQGHVHESVAVLGLYVEDLHRGAT